MARMSEERIESALTTKVFGCNLICLSRTGSTNDVAKELAAEGAPEGTVVLAEEQTSGRGRMGRRWTAPAGACLLCSILFRSDLPPAQVQQLTMLCSLAAADAVWQVADLSVALKWPNDLIIIQPPTSNLQSLNWRKLAGVLTETGVGEREVKFVVVGVGVNVNVPPDALPSLSPEATSILAETGRPVDRVALLAAFLTGIEHRYEDLLVGRGPRREWTQRLATLGRRVQAVTSGATLTGVAESVDESGALLLRTPDGALHRLLAGDVSLARA